MTKAQQNERIVLPFTLDDGKTVVEAIIDKQLAAKRSAAFDSLRVSRGISTGETVVTTPMVNYLVEIYNVPVQYAIDTVRKAMPGYIDTANRDALMVAVFDNLFRVDFQTGIPVAVFALSGYEISLEDFDDSEDNALRWLSAAQAPFPSRDPQNVIEQKLMYMQRLLENNKRFALTFIRTLEDRFGDRLQEEVDRRSVDVNGFRSRNVGIDPHAEINSDSETG